MCVLLGIRCIELNYLNGVSFWEVVRNVLCENININTQHNDTNINSKHKIISTARSVE